MSWTETFTVDAAITFAWHYMTLTSCCILPGIMGLDVTIKLKYNAAMPILRNEKHKCPLQDRNIQH